MRLLEYTLGTKDRIIMHDLKEWIKVGNNEHICRLIQTNYT